MLKDEWEEVLTLVGELEQEEEFEHAELQSLFRLIRTLSPYREDGLECSCCGGELTVVCRKCAEKDIT